MRTYGVFNMIDVLGDDMFALEYENKQKRLEARNNAITALYGFISGDVDLDDYNHIVAEYADTLEEIAASERNHLLIGVEDETSDNKEL